MKILKSFKYAIAGLLHCIATQRNFRFHIVAAVSVMIVSFFYNFTRFERLSLAFTIVFVLVCEMINTAIESTVDILGDEYNINAKIAKDVAAGAVMVSAALAVVVAFMLFWDIPTIGCILKKFSVQPLFWILVLVYVAIAVKFVIGSSKDKN